LGAKVHGLLSNRVIREETVDDRVHCCPVF